MSNGRPSVMPGGAQSQASLDASRPLDDTAMRKGIALLTLYQDSARHDPATLPYARWMPSRGHGAHLPHAPSRMLIFDRKAAVVPIDPSATKRGAPCVREPGVVASLRLLASGLTDEVAGPAAPDFGAQRAKADGRWQMAGLMERLETSSRFEAGLKAAQRGWLQKPRRRRRAAKGHVEPSAGHSATP